MKKLLCIIISVAVILTTTTACGFVSSKDETSSQASSVLEETFENNNTEINWDQEIKFTGLSDKVLLPYIEDTVYSDLVAELNTDSYFVEDVTAVYISQEYMEEIVYNSRKNVFFGYSLDELDEYFEGTRYVFTLGEDGATTVVPLETVEDTTFEQVLTNVAVGTGVILVCVTVSAVTGGVGAPAMSMIFAVAAKTAAVCALSGATISGVTAAAIRGYQTGDFSEALKAAAIGASEGFKWGAISGALSGGATKAFGLYSATGNGLTMNEVALIQKESGYPLNVIKQFHTMEEYNVFKQAGLQPQMVNGQLALVRTDIDLNQLDEYGRTNLERMLDGYSPLDSTGHTFELHHIGQKNDGTLAILTSEEHHNSSLHGFLAESEIDRPGFDKVRSAFWKTMAVFLSGGA